MNIKINDSQFATLASMVRDPEPKDLLPAIDAKGKLVKGTGFFLAVPEDLNALAAKGLAEPFEILPADDEDDACIAYRATDLGRLYVNTYPNNGADE